MPEIRHYKVTQTRTVRISANSAAGAAQIADAVFNGKDERELDIWGHANGSIREMGLDVELEH